MPVDNPTNEAPPSLRDIAEQAYDDLETAAEAEAPAEGPGPTDEAPAEQPLATDDRPRDKSGRWVAKDGSQPGEAIEPLDPAPKPKIEVQKPPTDPASAPAPRSNQVPEHWSAEDKATFAKLPQEGQAFLLKRHGEMEAEFTRKSQASAGAVQFTQALAPVFNDPQIAASLRQAGVHPVQAIQEWATWHKMGTSPDQQDKFKLLVGLTQRMGLDPARIFSALQNQPPPGPMNLSEEDLKDPAVKFIADHLGKTSNELATIRGELQRRDQIEQQARADWSVRSARQGIDGFADEKSKDGRPLRPHFDAVLPILIDFFKANPQRNLAEAYDAACWAHPEVRKQLLQAEQFRSQSQTDIAKARIAQRGNTRGVTTPVARPNGADGPSRGGIRDTIEQSADEVGF
jgi:hypothetical protein